MKKTKRLKEIKPVQYINAINTWTKDNADYVLGTRFFSMYLITQNELDEKIFSMNKHALT